MNEIAPSSGRLFGWSTLNVMLGGGSALDLPRMSLRSLAEAGDFLSCYGFDCADPDHKKELDEVRADAVKFIIEELLNPDEPGPPAAVNEASDLRHLLVMASAEDPSEERRWACAILRVMHTIAHARSPFNEWFGEQIRTQILGRFLPYVTDESGCLMLGDLRLHEFALKHTKPLRSVVMKLLHKAENVASDVFDRIGVRIVTEDRLDCLLAVRYLRKNHVVAFPNIKPSRSRNTLLDLARVRADVATVDAEIVAGRLSPGDRLEAVRRRVAAHPITNGGERNEHSASEYHALQFTCRQQIRIKAGTLGPSMPEARFFFPYEVQIMDAGSFKATRSGRASHGEYKRRQRRAVRARVLGLRR